MENRNSNIKHGTEILLNKQPNGVFKLSKRAWDIYVDKMGWDSLIENGERMAKSNATFGYIDARWSTSRDCPILIDIVKELGLDESAANNCQLEIVTIPEDEIRKWEIWEYRDNPGVEYIFKSDSLI